MCCSPRVNDDTWHDINAGIRLQDIFVFHDGHCVRLANHSAINSCHALIRRRCQFDPDQSSLTSLCIREEKSIKKLSIMATAGMSRNIPEDKSDMLDFHQCQSCVTPQLSTFLRFIADEIMWNSGCSLSAPQRCCFGPKYSNWTGDAETKWSCGTVEFWWVVQRQEAFSLQNMNLDFYRLTRPRFTKSAVKLINQ